jgi:hypothetical protein
MRDTILISDSDESTKPNAQEQAEDETLKAEEKRKKARRRTRGPYRKAHANW